MPTLAEIVLVLEPITVYLGFSFHLEMDAYDFSFLTKDSRSASAGGVFVAIKGAVSDGHDFITDVISSGVTLVICESVYDEVQSLERDCFFIKVKNTHEAYSRLAELFYNFPGRGMRFVGITGTNGKTTCAYLLDNIFNSSGLRSGLISTVEYSCGEFCMDADRTTPDALDFQKLLRFFADRNCSYTVMEVSSHALVQNRTGSTEFDVAIFTNLTGDHLDYHNTMLEYFNAKRELFTRHLDGGVAVVNIDDVYGVKLADELDNVKSYGFCESASFRIVKAIPYIITDSIAGSYFQLEHDGDVYDISIPLLGRYNIYNAAAVFVAAYILCVSPEQIVEGLRKSPQVPGRLEQFKMASGTLVFVDYAHTDDALKNVLTELRSVAESRCGRVICVFGCGGDRDSSKRRRMGSVASENSDVVIITSDNPRSEKPDKIMEDIVVGIVNFQDLYCISDREEAIKKGLMLAQAEDIVLIAGKGHETTQEIKGMKYSFDDREIVRACSKRSHANAGSA